MPVSDKIRRALRIDRALVLVWRSAPGWMMTGIVLMALQGAFPLLSLYLMKLVVDAVAEGVAAPDRGIAYGQVALLIGLAGLVVLVGRLCRSLCGIASAHQTQMVTDHVSDAVHSKSIQLDLEYYENPQYYDSLHRAQQEASHRSCGIVNGLMEVGTSGLTLLAMTALLSLFHWAIAVLLFASVLPGLFVRLRYADKMFRWSLSRTSTERRTNYLNRLLTGDCHAKELRLFGLGPLFMDRYRDLRRKLRGEKLGIAARRSMAELIAASGATIAMFGSFAFVAYRAVHGLITLGDLVMYYQAFQRGQEHLRSLLGGLGSLYENSLFLSSYYEFLDLQPKIIDPPHPRPVPRRMESGIVFDCVSFRYPTGTRSVLNDVSLTIRPGEHVALVGENGAGKTTLIKLLCRLYEPSSGRITIDGIDLRDFKVSELRREFSVIFQDYARYHMTARENIWLGDVDIPARDPRIPEAARRSGVHRTIAGLPDGYETILGKMFEEGEELSIGEWQKTALARAFLRHSPIVILDEPTSSLDARSEWETIRQFHLLAAGQTAVVISHRLSTVRMMDRIYVLSDGRISEHGNHHELVRSNEGYASLFEMQAQGYR